MKGLKHNGGLTIQTKTGFKGHNIPKDTSIDDTNRKLLVMFEECGVDLIG